MRTFFDVKGCHVVDDGPPRTEIIISDGKLNSRLFKRVEKKLKEIQGNKSLTRVGGIRRTLFGKKREELDPLLVHELLHGASMAARFLDDVGDKADYLAVWMAYPDAEAAYGKAQEAVAAFYQAMGAVSASLPERKK